MGSLCNDCHALLKYTVLPHNPKIYFVFSAFFWLLSLLFSSILWSAVVPLREKLAFGLVFSIFFQELFRYGIYALLSKADAYLKKLTENEETRIFANKHILAYGRNFVHFTLSLGILFKHSKQFPKMNVVSLA